MNGPKEPESASVTVTATSMDEDPAVPRPAEDASSLHVVRRDHYLVGHEHARGGLGRILVAEDRRLGRTVAVKELLRVEEKSARRFLREARLTAKLQHPGIVPVHEAGQWPSGEPFYTMKMVSGRSLKDKIAETKTLEERLLLLPNLIAVAEAIAYAHSQNVIHRDLKPSNVLVGEFGETVVVDWGLAKDLSEPGDAVDVVAGPYRSSGDEGLTEAGTVMGTPAYMPPEQARGESVDQRADVYSLGAMLYHLLTGEPPFAGSSENILKEVQTSSPRSLRDRAPGAPADLIAIIVRAMATDRRMRYADAGALAEDLRKFQAGQLVAVHDYTFGELIRRWIGKNRRLAAVSAVFLLVVLLGSTWFVTREQRLRHEAEGARDQTIVERDRAEAERARADRQTFSLMEDRGRDELQSGHPFRAAVYLTELLVRTPSPVYRSLVTEAIRAMELVEWSTGVHTAGVTSISFSHNDRLVLTGSLDGTASVIDAETGHVLLTLKAGGPLACSSFSLDDSKIITGAESGEALVWSAATGERITDLHGPSGPIRSCSFSPDGQTIMTGSKDGLRIWDALTGRLLYRVNHDDIASSIYSPDGRIAVAHKPGSHSSEVYSTADGRRVWTLGGHTMEVRSIVFSPDGRLIASASGDGTVRLWDASSGRLARVLRGRGPLMDPHFSSDGSRLVAGTLEGTAELWSVDDENSSTLRHEQKGDVLARFADLDGRVVKTLTGDGVLRLLLEDGSVVLSVDLPPGGHGPWATSIDGRRTVVGMLSGAIHMVHTPLEGHMKVVASRDSYVYRAQYLPEGNALGIGEHAGVAAIIDLKSMEVTTLHTDEHPIFRFEFSPTESRALTVAVYPSQTPKLWDLKTGHLVANLDGNESWIYDAEFSPDGLLIATASRRNTVRLWDGRTGWPIGPPIENAGQAVAFSPDNSRLATGGSSILIWDRASRKQLFAIEGHPTTRIDSLSYDQSGQRLLSGGWDDNIAKIWNASTGELLATLTGHTDRLMAAKFSPDGRLVVTAAYDQTARIWDAGTGNLLRIIQGPVHAVDFRADGTQLATGIGEMILLWDVTIDERSPEALADYVRAKSPWTLVDGRLVSRGQGAPAYGP